MNPSTGVRILYPEHRRTTIIKLIGINNPRTKEGGWEDESGCTFCGSVSSAYMGIDIADVIKLKICKGCLTEGEKKIDRLILDQTKHRV